MNNILNHIEIQQKITRLAHQIIENSFEESTIHIGGICGNGIILAEQFAGIIRSHSDQKVVVFEITTAVSSNYVTDNDVTATNTHHTAHKHDLPFPRSFRT